jgi:hypothetical protein
VIASIYFRGTPADMATSAGTATSSLVLLHSPEKPLSSQRSSIQKMVSALTKPSQPSVPTPAQPIIKKTVVIAEKDHSLAVETNPNTGIRSLPTEAILAPSTAPHLNPQSGVVFLLDVSGSMYEPYGTSTRLALARQTLARQIRGLQEGTPFAITLYAQNARTSGPLVAANDATREAAVRFIMRDVDCGGGTNLSAGLASADQLCPGNMVLVSDGDLNISIMNLMAQARSILGSRGHGPGLAIIGVAPRPQTSASRLLQDLADQQGGTYRLEQIENPTEVAASTSGKPASATP